MESQGYIHYGMHLVSICYCKKVTDKASLYNSLGKKLMEGLQPFENTQEIYVYTLF